RASSRLASQEAAETMARAMVAVATKPKGTGRRAPVEGLTMAMKTGTAGSRQDGGLESVIIAFAPAENPRIAFGMIAEDAGPAEFAGAKIAHDFLAAMKGRL
ncbi:MAG: FtsI5, partial [Acidobacteria bacterium]|nr:FtsI5 [Acidobacteriota bacterium]